MIGEPAHPFVDPDVPPLRELIDACVMCGVCLPHCPTYRFAGNEAESPRGRIALVRGLLDGVVGMDSKAVQHLDQCLGCLSCQSVCPSLVQYDDILIDARARLAGTRPTSLPRRALRSPRWLSRAARWAAWTRAWRWLPRLAGLFPKRSLARRMIQAQPAVPAFLDLPAVSHAARPGRRIAVMRGCVADVYERDTLQALRHLLEALGHDVVETPGGECCGALPRHAGDIAGADQAAHALKATLQASGTDIALTCASGCYGDLRDHVRPAAMGIAEATAFLVADAGWPSLRFRALDRRAALHAPCTQLNVIGGIGAVREALARIPGLTVVDLPLQPRCCGAAGAYFIEHPAIADALRDEKLAQARALAPDLLLTTNVGCRMHLERGLRACTNPPEVMHPLALLARQLDNAAS
jgi:glycolate oxidase iron-sulfur subunit